jgi:hypothetical protein
MTEKEQKEYDETVKAADMDAENGKIKSQERNLDLPTLQSSFPSFGGLFAQKEKKGGNVFAEQ